jgi:ClpX C4-type zinc finger protein
MLVLRPGRGAGQRLIAGPRVLICDDCVARCNAILAEHPLPPASGATREAEPPPPRSWARRLVDWWLVPSSVEAYPLTPPAVSPSTMYRWR